MQTAVVWSYERVKKTKQTEEEVGRQYQGMDRPGVRQVPEGSEEQEEVRAMIQQAIGPHEDLLTIVKRRKLQ